MVVGRVAGGRCQAQRAWQRVWLSHRIGRQPKTYVKPEAAITVFELLMMGGVSPKTCWAIKKHWNNQFYYTVASCWFFLWDEFEASNYPGLGTDFINIRLLAKKCTLKQCQLKRWTVYWQLLITVN
jgi:hypothetical protein